MRIVTALLVLACAASVLAGPGLNLYGFSHYPDEPDGAELNAELFGLGLQYDLRVREDSRLYLEGGGFNDIYENINLHFGLGYQHRVVGPLFAGGGLYLSRTESLNDGDPFLAPMPQLSLVGRPGSLTLMWNPAIEGVAEYEAFTLYATLFPCGRTGVSEGLFDGRSGRRSALEFSFDSDAGFGSLRGKQLVWRNVNPGSGGVRVGTSVDIETRELEVRLDESSVDEYAVSVFVEQFRYHGAGSGLRLFTVIGPEVGYANSTNYHFRPDPEAETTRTTRNWSAGLRFGLGAEWAVTDGIAFTAETGWRLLYRENTSIDESPIVSRSMQKTWSLSDTGVQTGVVLYFD